MLASSAARTSATARAMTGSSAGSRRARTSRISSSLRASFSWIIRVPASVTRTRTIRRSSATRVRSTNPRSSSRSMRPVAFESETPSTSARRLIVMTPLRWSVYMMWSWAMLMPSRTSRSLIAHFIAPIVTRKSAMMRSVGSSPADACRGDGCGRVDNLCHVNYVTPVDHRVNVNDPFQMQESRCGSR